MKLIIVLIITACFLGCGVPKEQHQKVLDENIQLKQELEQYIYGEERTIALIVNAYNEKNIELARKNIDTFIEYHPQSINNQKYTEIFNLVLQEERKIEEAKAAAEQEKIRQERLANIGRAPDNPIIIDARNVVPENIIRTLLLDKELYLNRYIL
jgi:hypothetical protein